MFIHYPIFAFDYFLMQMMRIAQNEFPIPYLVLIQS